MAISRLFSKARRIASFRDKYSLPSRMSRVRSGELMSSGSRAVSSVGLRVCYLNDRGSLLIQLTKEFHDFFGLAGMKIAGGFIRKEKRRFVDHGPRDSDQLLLAAGQLAGKQILLGDNLEAVEGVGHHTLALLVRDVFIREWKIDVFPYGQFIEQVIALKDHPDIALGEFTSLFAFHLVGGLAAKPELALPAVIEQGEDIQ